MERSSFAALQKTNHYVQQRETNIFTNSLLFISINFEVITIYMGKNRIIFFIYMYMTTSCIKMHFCLMKSFYRLLLVWKSTQNINLEHYFLKDSFLLQKKERNAIRFLCIIITLLAHFVNSRMKMTLNLLNS